MRFTHRAPCSAAVCVMKWGGEDNQRPTTDFYLYSTDDGVLLSVSWKWNRSVFEGLDRTKHEAHHYPAGKNISFFTWKFNFKECAFLTLFSLVFHTSKDLGELFMASDFVVLNVYVKPFTVFFSYGKWKQVKIAICHLPGHQKFVKTKGSMKTLC